MKNNILRLILIAVAVYVLYHIFSEHYKEEPVENEGTMSVDAEEATEEVMDEDGLPHRVRYANGMKSTSPTYSEYGDKLKKSSPGVSPQDSCPQLTRVGMPKKIYHSQINTVEDPSCDYQLMKNNSNVLPYPQFSNNYAPQYDVNQQFTNSYQHQQVKLDCFPKDQLIAEDLLPREDGYNTWQEVNPQAQGHLTDQNFLESGHHFGINTVGQSLKNPNKQLRSDPVIPQVATGPWLQSTFEPDTNRRFFEIGQC